MKLDDISKQNLQNVAEIVGPNVPLRVDPTGKVTTARMSAEKAAELAKALVSKGAYDVEVTEVTKGVVTVTVVKREAISSHGLPPSPPVEQWVEDAKEGVRKASVDANAAIKAAAIKKALVLETFGVRSDSLPKVEVVNYNEEGVPQIGAWRDMPVVESFFGSSRVDQEEALAHAQILLNHLFERNPELTEAEYKNTHPALMMTALLAAVKSEKESGVWNYILSEVLDLPIENIHDMENMFKMVEHEAVSYPPTKEDMREHIREELYQGEFSRDRIIEELKKEPVGSYVVLPTAEKEDQYELVVANVGDVTFYPFSIDDNANIVSAEKPKEPYSLFELFKKEHEAHSSSVEKFNLVGTIENANISLEEAGKILSRHPIGTLLAIREGGQYLICSKEVTIQGPPRVFEEKLQLVPVTPEELKNELLQRNILFQDEPPPPLPGDIFVGHPIPFEEFRQCKDPSDRRPEVGEKVLDVKVLVSDGEQQHLRFSVGTLKERLADGQLKVDYGGVERTIPSAYVFSMKPEAQLRVY